MRACGGVQFSLRSLLIGTAVLAVVLGLGRMILPAVAELAPKDWSLFGWLAGLAAFAVATGAIFIYANR